MLPDETLDPENWDEMRKLGHQMLEDMFKGQPEVIEYLKGMMKGYALQKCVETGDNLIKIIQEGKVDIAMVDFIPQDLAPKIESTKSK